MTPPFRADHIGSLLRPPPLRDAHRRHAMKTLGDAEFERIQDAAIRDVLAMQRDVGLRVVTDGEFRRGSYWGRFVSMTEGLAIAQSLFNFRDERGDEVGFTVPEVVGKVKRKAPIGLPEYAFAAKATDLPVKITMPAPSTMHMWRLQQYAREGVYAEPRAFFADLAKVYQAEIADLAAAGCRYVQLDEVALVMLCDPVARERVRALGEDPDALVDLYIDAINDAVRNRPAEMAIGVHVCRGNFKGHFLAEGGYDAIADKFFNRTNATHFLLEYDTARAGSFAPLALVPRNRGVVLGLVSSKTPELEAADALARRIDEAGRHIELTRLALSPQCGFASTVGGNPLSEADERAKLSRCVEVARKVWGTA